MQLRRLSPAVLTFATVALAACSKPQPPTITTITPTAVMADQHGVTVGLQVGMHNPNRVAIPVKAVNAHLNLDDKLDLGDVQTSEAVTIPAGQDANVPVSIPIAWTDIGQMAVLAGSPHDVKYKASGTVTLGGDLVNVTVPFEATGTLKQQDIAQGTMKTVPKTFFK
jgi:LEA14-like dessication related protein